MIRHEFIAVKGITNCIGIGIVEIDPYGDYVKFQWSDGEKRSKLTKAPIYSEYNLHTGDEDFYFVSYRQKHYLKEFMRANI